jgi:hypothetical protein
VRASHSGRWNIYIDYDKIGYFTRSYSGRLNVYVNYLQVGYASSSYAGRWNAYVNYQQVGYATGLAAPIGAATLAALVAYTGG